MNSQSFKQRDIKPCMCCGKKLAAGGVITFFRVDIQYMVLNIGNLDKQAGLEMMFGGGLQAAAIAHVMGTDQEMATVTGEASGLVCFLCGAGKGLSEIYETSTSVGDAAAKAGENVED